MSSLLMNTNETTPSIEYTEHRLQATDRQIDLSQLTLCMYVCVFYLACGPSNCVCIYVLVFTLKISCPG